MPYAHIKFENYLCVAPVQWWPLASILPQGVREKTLNILQQTYIFSLFSLMFCKNQIFRVKGI